MPMRLVRCFWMMCGGGGLVMAAGAAALAASDRAAACAPSHSHLRSTMLCPKFLQPPMPAGGLPYCTRGLHCACCPVWRGSYVCLMFGGEEEPRGRRGAGKRGSWVVLTKQSKTGAARGGRAGKAGKDRQAGTHAALSIHQPSAAPAGAATGAHRRSRAAAAKAASRQAGWAAYWAPGSVRTYAILPCT